MDRHLNGIMFATEKMRRDIQRGFLSMDGFDSKESILFLQILIMFIVGMFLTIMPLLNWKFNRL